MRFPKRLFSNFQGIGALCGSNERVFTLYLTAIVPNPFLLR